MRGYCWLDDRYIYRRAVQLEQSRAIRGDRPVDDVLIKTAKGRKIELSAHHNNFVASRHVENGNRFRKLGVCVCVHGLLWASSLLLVALSIV
jgi:hypothetical protein